MKKIYAFAFLILTCFTLDIYSQQSEIIKKEIIDSSTVPQNHYIEIQYPVLKGLYDTKIQDFINSEIEIYIKSSVDTFKNELKDWELPTMEPNMQSGFYIDYDAAINKNTFSVILFIEPFFAGSAHPSHESHSMNFDLSTGKQIRFADLFDNQKKYLSKISKFCINYLKNNKEDLAFDDEWLKAGAGPDPENFKNFNIQPEGLTITFDPYQVAAYAYGYQNVIIPYKEIKDIVNKEGPLKEFYK